MPVYAQMKHIDLMEIAARCERSGVSHRGKHYLTTEPGKADMALVSTVIALKDLWAVGAIDVRMADIEKHNQVAAISEGALRLAASLKRLERMSQVKLDFDREGVIIRQGRNWIETDP